MLSDGSVWKHVCGRKPTSGEIFMKIDARNEIAKIDKARHDDLLERIYDCLNDTNEEGWFDVAEKLIEVAKVEGDLVDQKIMDGLFAYFDNPHRFDTPEYRYDHDGDQRSRMIKCLLGSIKINVKEQFQIIDRLS